VGFDNRKLRPQSPGDAERRRTLPAPKQTPPNTTNIHAQSKLEPPPPREKFGRWGSVSPEGLSATHWGSSAPRCSRSTVSRAPHRRPITSRAGLAVGGGWPFQDNGTFLLISLQWGEILGKISTDSGVNTPRNNRSVPSYRAVPK